MTDNHSNNDQLKSEESKRKTTGKGLDFDLNEAGIQNASIAKRDGDGLSGENHALDSASKELKESKVTATSVEAGQKPTPPTATAQGHSQGQGQGL